jgi:hypothetical protein
MNKKCFKCGIIKPVDSFYRHKETADGYLGKCKTCTKRDVKKRYDSDDGRAKIIAYEKSRFKDPERKKKIANYQKKSRESRPGAYRARNAVSNAVRDGRLIRLPCEICGDAKSQAHHDDYRRPLSVRWLCFKHHREIEHGQQVTAVK